MIITDIHTMVDREKIIKGLEKCKRHECDDCTEKGASKAPWDCPAYDYFVDSAIALLKEQEPKPVELHTNAYGKRFYFCPKCKRELFHTRNLNFCERCGQAVIWNEG